MDPTRDQIQERLRELQRQVQELQQQVQGSQRSPPEPFPSLGLSPSSLPSPHSSISETPPQRPLFREVRGQAGHFLEQPNSQILDSDQTSNDLLSLSIGGILRGQAPTTGEESTATDLAEQMEDEDSSYLLVTNGDEPVGVVTSQHLVSRILAQNQDPSVTNADEVMDETPVVSIEASVSEVLAQMAAEKTRHVPVVDENSFIDVVTLDDLIVLFTKGRGELHNISQTIETNPFGEFQ